MKASRILSALGPMDAKQALRDPLLRWLLAYPVFVALALRWATPPLNAHLLRRYGFDLAPYYPLLMSFVLISTPMMAGTVIGFLLLDQKDDRTLSALLVTPLPAEGYLAYRIALPMVVSGAVTLLVFPLAGLTPIPFWSLAAATTCAAPLAPFYALVLAGFAANKVQGFALTKAMGVLMIPAAAAWFVPEPWHWLAGLTPLFWPAKVLWMLEGGERFWWLALAAGLAVQSLFLAALLRRYRRGLGD